MEFAAEQRAKGAVLVAVTLNVASDQLLVCGPYITIGDKELKDATFWAKTHGSDGASSPYGCSRRGIAGIPEGYRRSET